MKRWILVINIFPILKIYPWFRYIQSWRDVGSVMKRESSLLTYNLSPFLLSNSVRCKKAKSWLTCPIKTRRVSCSSYYSVVMILTKPIQLWVMVMLLLVLCPLMIKIKTMWINHLDSKNISKYENKTYILWVWPNSNAIETFIARKGYKRHDHNQPGSGLITSTSYNVLCQSLHW